MLARSGRLPTTSGYAYEVKWDGFRALVSRNGRRRVLSRRGWDMSALLPELDVPDGVTWTPAGGRPRPGRWSPGRGVLVVR
jgi:ATP-dependent DNA ligase